MVEIALMLAASTLLWLRPRSVPMWAGHVALALLTVGNGLLPTVAASAALGDVVSVLLFLALAVPLAVALDDMGGVSQLAHGTYRATMTARSGQDPRGNGESIGPAAPYVVLLQVRTIAVSATWPSWASRTNNPEHED